MPRGGKRENAGRKISERPTDGNVARKVKAQVHAEKLWVSLIRLECKRLGINENGELSARVDKSGVIDGPDFQGKFSVIPLSNILRYLDDRDLGRPVDTVNHLHDKPIDVNMKLSLGEGMRVAMEKAEQRVRSRG